MAETPDRTPTRSCSVREMASGSNLFVIQGYSMAKGVGVGNHIASEEFTMAGCKWALYFYPDGRSEEDKLDFISVFLSLKSNAEDFPLLLELTLMDLSGKGEHLVKMCSEKSVLSLQSRGSMWGYNDFFRRSGLETSDFLRDDCLKIFCNVVADLSVGSNIGDDSEHKDVFTGDDGIHPEKCEDLAPKIKQVNLPLTFLLPLGDDSEHKDVFTGDDGIHPEKCEDLAPKIKQDDENMDEAGEEGELSKSGKELMELLPRPANRPNDSDADDKDNDDDMEDIPLKAIPSAAGCGTSSASKSSKVASKCSGEGSKTLNNAPLEKANEEDELPVKDENASSSESGATPPASSTSVAAPPDWTSY